MALPSNYKQIAIGAPTGPSTPAPTGSSRSRSSGAGGGSDRNKDTTPIFSHSNYGNPAFTPQKAGKQASSKNQAEARVPKPPKPPEKPVLPHMRYSKRVWDSVKAQYPDLKLWELGKKIGSMWNDLNEKEKREFIDEYEADKLEYEKILKAYHNSPSYVSYLAARSKLKTDADVHETPSRASGKSQQERRIDIQPAEDEDDQDEGYSFKHLAYARYIRNHRLINEIFSDSVVPDVRSVVTTQRMQVLKRQVSSLTMHQTKLEAELQQMEEKFEAKKQRMVESSEGFQEELKRHCKPAVDDEAFQKMVQKMYEDMKRQRMEDPSGGVPTGPHGAVSRPEDKQTTAPVNSGGSAGQAAGSAVKKDVPPKATHESDSKTDPEPMDIEPPQKPSVPQPPAKTESRAAGEVAAKAQKTPTSEQAKETVKPPGGSKSAHHTTKTTTPTPTPTPTPPPATSATANPSGGEPQQAPLAATLPPPNQIPLAPQPPNTQATASGPPPPQSHPPQQQQQMPPTMPMHPHHGPPPHQHLPPHMPPHQPPISGMPPHGAYGNYGAPAGPQRSQYYQPQYAGHPPQPYGQYAPYSHYQQPYGPPPGSHYMNSRPPPQHNGSPVHYPEHGGPPLVSQQPPPGHMGGPHDGYPAGPPPHAAGPPPPPQQQGLPPNVVPPTAGALPPGAPGSAGPPASQPPAAPTTAATLPAADHSKAESEKADE